MLRARYFSSTSFSKTWPWRSAVFSCTASCCLVWLFRGRKRNLICNSTKDVPLSAAMNSSQIHDSRILFMTGNVTLLAISKSNFLLQTSIKKISHHCALPKCIWDLNTFIKLFQVQRLSMHWRFYMTVWKNSTLRMLMIACFFLKLVLPKYWHIQLSWLQLPCNMDLKRQQ